MKVIQIFFLLLMGIFMFLTCSHKDTVGPEIIDDEDKDTIKTFTIKPTDSLLINLNDNIEILFYRGCVEKETQVQLKELNKNLHLDIYSNANSISPIYVITPHNLQLKLNVKIKIDFSTSQLPPNYSLDDLIIASFDGNNLETHKTSVYGTKLICTTDHFSSFFVRMKAGVSLFGNSEILDTQLSVYKQDGYLCFENIFGDISVHLLKFAYLSVDNPVSNKVNYEVTLYESPLFGFDKMIYAKQSCRIAWLNTNFNRNAIWHPHKMNNNLEKIADEINYSKFPQNCFDFNENVNSSNSPIIGQEVIIEYDENANKIGSPIILSQRSYTNSGKESLDFMRKVFLSDELRRFIRVDQLDESKEYNLKVEIEYSDWMISGSSFRKSQDFKLKDVPEVSSTNTPPSIQIISPLDNSSHDINQNLLFFANITDNDLGVTDDRIEWYSNVNGLLGKGKRIYYSGLFAGRHQISCVATDAGGLGTTESVTINISGSQSNSWIKGKVYFIDEDIPVQDAFVVLVPRTNTPRQTLYTDENGKYNFKNVTEGDYYLIVSESDLGLITIFDPSDADIGNSFFVDKNQVIDLGIIYLNENLTRLSGFLRNKNIGDPLSNIEVYLYDSISNSVKFSSTTDDNGQFYIPYILEPNGEFWLGLYIENRLITRYPNQGTFTVLAKQLNNIGIIELDNSALNTPPLAGFNVTPTSGTLETLFTFDASQSTDIEDQVSDLRVRWDWENDSNWDTEFSTNKISTHQYLTNGTKTIKLEVIDTGGLSSFATSQVSVIPNTPPIAYFTVSPSSGSTQTTFLFDASGSSDNEDATSALHVRWDFDNDGNWDTNYSLTKTITHRFVSTGTKTIKLEVKDSGGLTNTITRQLSVGSVNTPPTANFTVSPTSGNISTLFNFDASSCSDSEDPTSALQVRWDWENNGIYDTDWSFSKSATHQYSSTGTKTIKLAVIDSYGLVNFTTNQVSVTDGSFETGTVTDIDGNVYKTVKIGNQWWMAENLKVTHYRNGDAIPNVAGNSEWYNLRTGAYCNYDNNEVNVTTYGCLYNWYAVNDSRNIAPAGWHVPSDAEWQTLVNHMGGESVAGGKLKDIGTSHWNSPNTGATNESGFSALPSGYRKLNGSYIGMGNYAIFWSSTVYYNTSITIH